MVTTSKQRKILEKFYNKLRSRVDDNGKPLCNEKINKIKTAIAGLEHRLGIDNK